MTPAVTFTLKSLVRVEPNQLDALADVLVDCVDGGASVSFMAPLTRERARAFWQGVAADVDAGHRVLLVVEDGEGICGTVQLVLSQPENQPHRADVSKMLVHRRARNRGIAGALMREIDVQARRVGKTLLVLDTASDTAERVYQRQGWIRAGVIPGYALLPHGGPCDTVLYYRELPLDTGAA